MDVTTIAQSDIFFFITSISVVIITILLVVALIKLISVLTTIKEVSEVVKVEGKNIVTDISSLRQGLKEKGKVVSAIMTAKTVASIITGKKKKKTTKKEE